MNHDLDYYREYILQFFDFNKPVPTIFKNAAKLRKEYIAREQVIREKSLCVGCDIVQFRAFFIENNLLPNIKEEPIVK